MKAFTTFNLHRKHYYPFGMLMPGRYVHDTADHCAMLTQTMMVPKKITDTLTYSATLCGSCGWTATPPATFGFAGGLMDISATVPMTGVSYAMTVPTLSEVDITMSITSVTGTLIAEVDDSTGSALTSTVLPPTGFVAFGFSSPSTTVTLKLTAASPVTAAIGTTTRTHTIYTPGTVTGLLCNQNKDYYRFGFNGQEKDNQIAGIGNFTGAEFWEYNTRIGRRWNTDPITEPNQSSYSANNNNPIFFDDPTGKHGVGSWEEDKKGKKTLVVKANYHYIKGQFDANVLKAAKEEYATFKNVKYKDANINVKFEINFVEHDEGTDLSKYDGTNGENALVNKRLDKKDDLENATGSTVNVDVDKDRAKTVLYKDEEGKIYEAPVSESDQEKREVSSIIHGIGHNLGFKHGDGDVMEEQHTYVTKTTDYLDKTKTTYISNFHPNHVTKTNAQKLVDRLDEMHAKGTAYWDDKKDEEGSLRGQGVILQKDNEASTSTPASSTPPQSTSK